MDFELDDVQRMIRDTARDFARRVIAPEAARIDREAQIPRGILEELARLGLMGVNVPEELGGVGAGSVAYSLAMSEIAYGCASTSVTMAVTNMVGEVIAAFGTEAQRMKYNPKLCSGTLGAFALSEAEAGSDPGAMRTVARRDENGWVIDGTKQWISHGDLSGVLVVWARTGDAGARGLSCFLIEPDMPGFGVSGKEDKMGLRGSSTCSLAFEGMRVPADALLGGEGDGFKIAMMALDGGRIGIASQAIGIGEAAHDAAVRYARERRQFGAPIAEHQAIQWMIAESRTDLDASRVLTLRAAWLKERARRFTQEASMAKVFASEAAWRVCNSAVQVHGGYGYTREFPVERHLRDVRVTQIYEGTSEVQRIVISRNLLRA